MTTTPTQATAQIGVNAAQTRAAIFLVLGVKPGAANAERSRLAIGGLDALQRAVGARDIEGNLSFVAGFGSDVWERLFGLPKPADLHPFRELRAGTRFAPATPGDILLHIRAERMDLCFEFAAQATARFADSVTFLDEVHGFRYFDDRDLTGFVDGTENPAGEEKFAVTLVGDEDPAFAGGSYVMVQRYVHNLPAWHKLPTETQEGIIGRTKLDDIELDEAVKPTYAHNALTTLVENGQEIKILRHNMPFGNVSGGDAGTYFIGYARSLHPLERMLEKMVIGDPRGNYDRLLDFTHPVTGTDFFAPSAEFLAALENGKSPPPLPLASAVAAVRSTSSVGAATLGIGSLKGVPQHE